MKKFEFAITTQDDQVNNVEFTFSSVAAPTTDAQIEEGSNLKLINATNQIAAKYQAQEEELATLTLPMKTKKKRAPDAEEIKTALFKFSYTTSQPIPIQGAKHRKHVHIPSPATSAEVTPNTSPCKEYPEIFKMDGVSPELKPVKATGASAGASSPGISNAFQQLTTLESKRKPIQRQLFAKKEKRVNFKPS